MKEKGRPIHSIMERAVTKRHPGKIIISKRTVFKETFDDKKKRVGESW